MDSNTGNYLIGSLIALISTTSAYIFSKRKTLSEARKNDADSADIITKAAATLINSYERRIKDLEEDMVKARQEISEALAENKALRKEVIRLESIIYNKGDIDK